MAEETNIGNSEEKRNHSFTRKSIEKVAEQFVAQLRKLAVYLQHRSELLSRRTKLVLLGLFLLVGSGCSLYLILNSLAGKYQLSITSVKHFPFINKTMAEVNRNIIVVTKRDYLAVQNFRKYLDSIKFSPGGKIEYEKIIHERAGLLDSMDEIEHIYKQQQKETSR
ncbi:hypothetical protein [Pedobacter sp. WC2423]|uniref:hypothetical protein n=1 Tax=Pedobacter sp. WC2423 TaxID=3234142 RepID=UPI003465D469